MVVGLSPALSKVPSFACSKNCGPRQGRVTVSNSVWYYSTSCRFGVEFVVSDTLFLTGQGYWPSPTVRAELLTKPGDEAVLLQKCDRFFHGEKWCLLATGLELGIFWSSHRCIDHSATKTAGLDWGNKIAATNSSTLLHTCSMQQVPGSNPTAAKHIIFCARLIQSSEFKRFHQNR